MKTFTFAVFSPVVISFFVVRFLLRAIALIILPFELIFMLFGYGLAWLLFLAWRLVTASNTSATPCEESDEEAVDWKAWGYCMTEAGYDTLTAVIMFVMVVQFGLGVDILTPTEKLLGNNDFLIWIPFWLIALLPFLIRVNSYAAAETPRDQTEPVWRQQSRQAP